MTDLHEIEVGLAYRAVMWPSLLATNIAIGCGLTKSHALGHASCICDWGPNGTEWWPGIGCAPEQCTRLPDDATDDHVFEPATEPPFIGACRRCRERLEHYSHMTPNHPDMRMEDEVYPERTDESTWYWTSESLTAKQIEDGVRMLEADMQRSAMDVLTGKIKTDEPIDPNNPVARAFRETIGADPAKYGLRMIEENDMDVARALEMISIAISRAPTRPGGPGGKDAEEFELDELYSGDY